MTRTKLVLKNGIMLTITTAGLGIFGIFFNAFIARKIGAEAMGIFSLVMSVYTFATVVAVSGVNLAATRLVATSSIDSQRRRAVIFCIGYALFFSTIATIALLCASQTIAQNLLHQPEAKAALRALAISLPFVAVSSVLSGYFAAIQAGVRASSTVILEQVARVIITAFLIGGSTIAMGKTGIGEMVFAIALGETASAIIGAIGRFLGYKWKGQQRTTPTPPITPPLPTHEKPLLNKLLSIALPMAFSSYLKSMLTTLKQTLVPLNFVKFGMLQAVAVATYGRIQGMVLPLLFFPTCFLISFAQLIVPEVASLSEREHFGRIKSVTSRIFKGTMIFSIFVSSFFIAFAEKISVMVYATDEIAWLVRIFAFSLPISYFDFIVDSLLKGLNKQVAVVNINIMDSIFTIGLICTLIPKWGIYGYIIVFFASEAFNAVLSISKLLRTTACRFELMNWVIKPGIAAAIAIASHNMLAFPIVFIAVLFISKALQPEDFKL